MSALPPSPPLAAVWPGRPSPLGATFDGRGVNFALFSDHATKVELCLFDTADPDAPARTFSQMATYPLAGRSLVVLRAKISNNTP